MKSKGADIITADEKKKLKRLMQKVIVWKFSSNLDKELKRLRIRHASISRQAGRVETAFNKTIKQVEDIRISSFIRYWVAIEDILKKNRMPDELEMTFESLIDDEIRALVEFSSDLFNDDANYILDIEKTFFVGIKVHIESMKLVSSVLTHGEIEVYEKIYAGLKD